MKENPNKYKLSKEDIPGIMTILGILVFMMLLLIVIIYIQNGRL